MEIRIGIHAGKIGHASKATLASKKVPLVGGALLALSPPLSVRQQSHQLLGQQSATAMQSEPKCLTHLTTVLEGTFGIVSLD